MGVPLTVLGLEGELLDGVREIRDGRGSRVKRYITREDGRRAGYT